MTTQPTQELLDPLTRALRERGFELFVAVRVASPVQNKIGVIKEVRLLTGVGLKAAKDAVEQEQVILDALRPDQAERVSERLAAAGGCSGLLLARAHLYAYVPGHPRREGQTCQRLRVEGQTLELAQGQLGTWGQAQVVPFDDGDLLAAIDRQRASWAAAGWCEAGSELEIMRRVGIRDEQLEARIRAADGSELAHEAAVYGDWLQAKGDVRGIVASCALSLDAAQDDAERTQRAAALAEVVTEHLAHLFGPARPLLDLGCMQVQWIGPLLAAADVAGPLDDFDPTHLLEHLLALPASAALRKLSLRQPFTDHASLAELLARSTCASSLRSLCVLQSPRVRFVDATFERLEQLELVASELGFTSSSFPALRKLSLEFRELPNKLEPCFVGLDAPALEHFELITHVYEYWDHHHGPLQSHLADVLHLPAFARLRSLTLRSRASGTFDRGLARIFARLPARRTLECIDLRQAALAPEARAELEASRDSLPELLLG